MGTLKAEEWRPIAGYEQHYSVSSHGRIRNEKTHRVTYGANHDGYKRILIGNASHYVHRLVAKAFIGDPPPGHNVNHKNGVRGDNRPVNLEYATQLENVRHARDVLRVNFGPNQVRGERHGLAKLTEQQVKEIKSSPSIGCRALGKRYGVDKAIVQRIRKNQIWRHVNAS